MTNKLFGKKLGMARHFLEEGKSVPVTILQVESCIVTQKKTQRREGYNAIQVGFGPQKQGRINKPLRGHFDKAIQGKYFAHLREIRVDDPDSFELGQEIKSDFINVGDRVHVRGISKGRGFSGVIKRWGFSGGKKTHGSCSHRIPGSIGSSALPSRVLKGKKLPGRMGYQRVTLKNIQVIDVRPEMNVILVGGSVPGSRNSFVEIRKP
jgi:large subunit ribosomal protein L3